MAETDLQIAKRVGAVFRRHREALKLSQEDFAEQLHMHRTYYSAIERGRIDFRISTLERICKTLNVKIADVMCEARS